MNKTALAYRELGAKRFRETFGLCYEDFKIGDVFEHRPGRTITDEHRPGNTITDVDNILVTLLTMNIQPVFLDEAYATSTEWKKRLIDSTLTVALLTAMSVRTVGANVVANLGWDKVKATHPVFVGDTLYAESTVLSKRESVSQPTQGIVTVSTRGLNQDGKEVMNFERKHADLQTEALTRSCSRKLTSCVRNLNQELFSAPPRRTSIAGEEICP